MSRWQCKRPRHLLRLDVEDSIAFIDAVVRHEYYRYVYRGQNKYERKDTNIFLIGLVNRSMSVDACPGVDLQGQGHEPLLSQRHMISGPVESVAEKRQRKGKNKGPYSRLLHVPNCPLTPPVIIVSCPSATPSSVLNVLYWGIKMVDRIHLVHSGGE